MEWMKHVQRRFAQKLSVFAVTALVAGTSFAHVFPQFQKPGAGAAVASPPSVRITFDGPLEAAFSSLTVMNGAGKQVNLEKAKVDSHHPDVMTVALPALVAGRYTVQWVAVASDGHRTHGDYSFEVTAK